MISEKILRNDFSILMARSNEAKTSFLCHLIEDYKKHFKGEIYAFGMKAELVNLLKIESFSSLLELEEIKNSIVIVDEVRILFDLENRKNKRAVDTILRKVNHNGNKMLASGLPSDFKKFLCAKAKCFIYKSLMISDMVNGCMAKEILSQYKDDAMGVHYLSVPKNEVLIYDGSFSKYQFGYDNKFDTKRLNTNLFEKKSKSCNEKGAKNVSEIVLKNPELVYKASGFSAT